MILPAAAVATTAETAAIVVTPFLVVTTFGVDLAAEHVQMVTHMEHGVGVDTIVTRLAAARGVDPGAEVGLLTQQVVSH